MDILIHLHVMLVQKKIFNDIFYIEKDNLNSLDPHKLHIATILSHLKQTSPTSSRTATHEFLILIHLSSCNGSIIS